MCRMMVHITEKDIKLAEEAAKWYDIDENGEEHLREDAPEKIKKHHEHMIKIYSSLPE